ncbi:hypothetical protein PR202_ga08459 [Eleusine coracana subsp. coracana]|uniref:Uncharacterized protein n=1 Tax=Eleusine coracana subsp. coracana TaxID=191504 RepID=A0AAV5C1G1_ELECO|nr:hypothetical protein PR202_ga08459 [Eleusine coracana subsp. coracana]
METEDLLKAAPSWPCPFSAAYEALLLELMDEETLLRPEPWPAPPSISDRRPLPKGSKGLRSATALIRSGGVVAP